jgi:hypothetical protein
VALEAKVEEIRSTLKINPEIQDICPHCQEDSHTSLQSMMTMDELEHGLIEEEEGD